MRGFVVPLALVGVLGFGLSAFAEESGAPAAPSGSPASAAQQGSSTAGEAGSKNEMSSHEANTAKQGQQANPHKQAQ